MSESMGRDGEGELKRGRLRRREGWGLVVHIQREGG